MVAPVTWYSAARQRFPLKVTDADYLLVATVVGSIGLRRTVDPVSIRKLANEADEMTKELIMYSSELSRLVRELRQSE